MIVKQLGLQDYETTYAAMQEFTRNRNQETPDELWVVEHPPTYTLGMGTEEGDILDAGNIPMIKADRNGGVTYHGPGQAILYTLLSLRGEMDIVS